MNLKDKLSEILYTNNVRISDYSYKKKIQFNLNIDGDIPSFSSLLKLSKLFGTEEIDINHYIYSEGCDTCGYGREEGNTIEIYNPTKNIEVARKLAKESK